MYTLIATLFPYTTLFRSYRVAIMTSVYTTSMSIFATTASGVSIPLAEGWDLGWQLSLFVWVVPAVIGLFIWLLIVMNNRKKNAGEQRHYEPDQSSGILEVPLA